MSISARALINLRRAKRQEEARQEEEVKQARLAQPPIPQQQQQQSQAHVGQRKQHVRGGGDVASHCAGGMAAETYPPPRMEAARANTCINSSTQAARQPATGAATTASPPSTAPPPRYQRQNITRAKKDSLGKTKPQQDIDSSNDDIIPAEILPKTFASSVPILNEVPREVQFRRKRVRYDEITGNSDPLSMDSLLEVHGVPSMSSHADPAASTKTRAMPLFHELLPLEGFDDRTLDEFTPEDWMSRGTNTSRVLLHTEQKNHTKESISSHHNNGRPHTAASSILTHPTGLPCVAFQKRDNASGSARCVWQTGRVLQWDTQRDSLVVEWDGGSEDPKNSTSSVVPRVYVMLLAENPHVFAARFAQAYTRRQHAERVLRRDLYVNCLPMDVYQSLDPTVAARICQMGLSTPQLKQFKQRLSVQPVLQSISTDYGRTMNIAVFEHVVRYGGLQRFLSIAPLPPPPTRSTTAGGGDASISDKSGAAMYEGVNEQQRQAVVMANLKRVPHNGLQSIPPSDFANMMHKLHGETYLHTQHPVRLVLQCVAQLNEAVLSECVFGVAPHVVGKAPLTLTDFEELESTRITESAERVCNKWGQGIQAHVKSLLANTKATDEVFLNALSKAQYEGTKMQRLITSIELQVEDTLHHYLTSSCEAFVRFLESFANFDVTVDSMHHVTATGRASAPHSKALWGNDDRMWETLQCSVPSPRVPLFSVALGAADGAVGFSTPLEEFAPALLALFRQAIASHSKVRRIEPLLFNFIYYPVTQFVKAIAMDDEVVLSWTDRIQETMQNAIQPLKAYLDTLEPFRAIVALDVDTFVEDFASKKHRPQAAQAIIEEYRTLEKRVEESIPDDLFFGLFHVTGDRLRRRLAGKCSSLVQRLLDVLVLRSRTMADEVDEKYSVIRATLVTPANTPEEVIERKDFMKSIPERTVDLQTLISGMSDVSSVLDHFCRPLKDDEFVKKWQAVGWPSRLDEELQRTTTALDQVKRSLTASMNKEQEGFAKEVDVMAKTVSEFHRNVDISKLADIAENVRQTLSKLQLFRDRANQFNAHEEMFGLDKTDYADVRKLATDFEPYATLWTTVDNWSKWFHQWNTESFDTIDADEMAQNVQTAFKDLTKICREPRFRDKPLILKVAEDALEAVEQFRPIVPTIQCLRARGMSDRHWTQISEELGFEVRPHVTLRSLDDVYKMKLNEHNDVLVRTSEVASREDDINTSLQRMKQDWDGTKLSVQSYKSTGCYIIGKDTIDEVQELLDDQMLIAQGLSFSPFKKMFEGQIEEWEGSLKLVQQVLDEWILCQRAWLYLEPIFQSEDIARQLPNENKRFLQMGKNWSYLTGKAHEIDLAMKFCTETEKCLELLKENNEHLDHVQRGLNQYLENKRSAFARFYFLSDDELLTILSEAKNPQNIQPHFRKLFESIAKMDMRGAENEMVGMYSQMNEYIPFAEPVVPKQYVENWLSEVETMMKRSMRLQLTNGVKNAATMSRKDFVLSAAGQVAIAINQIMWTHECEEHLERDGTLEKYVPQANENLMILVETVRQPLTNLQRMNLSGLITIEVHARDIVERLTEEKVTSALDFDWISQLRSYWENGDYILRQVEAQFKYGGEYLGNSTRLVITPLTDRIYLTLTGAMHMFLGSAPAGPAGTGKTETVKDLAKAVAKQCVVFNCQEGMTYASMGKFFKGLAQAGAWACFDEFNRIDVEVLSVVAQQVSSLQEAGRINQLRITFEGVEILVDPSHSVFITMNPGYAGRTELPDNLKVLFRPVACMVPDYAMIAEIRLFSFGYADSRKLAQKMVATFRLSSEQLSSQDHYDFGMRAVNTVISAAGLMKREYPNDPEDTLLLRALRDSNAPKFLKEDLLLFSGIISDLFPDVVVPQSDYGEFDTVLREIALDMKLQPTDLFVTKCIQLYEMSVLRHGQMTVGPSMSGKTCATRVLQKAMTKLKAQDSKSRFSEVKTHCLNPKAITMMQLYGGFDEATGEWRDGIVGEIFRLAASDTSDAKQWIVFDGPVDALWIESMNTVLDENKKLCLISGEIITMTSEMNVWFEVEDLAVASPATVSRAGMIYMEPATCLGVESFISSWVDFQLPPTMDNLKEDLATMCTTLFPSLIEFVQTSVTEYNPTSWPNLVQSCFRIYNAFLPPFTPSASNDVGPDRIAALVEIHTHLLVFSIVWSFGATGDNASRRRFDRFLRDELRRSLIDLELPVIGILHDYEFVLDERRWVLWTDRVPAFSASVTPSNYADIIVPTADVARYSYLGKHLLSNSYHTLLCGPTGTGKTVIMHQLLLNGMPKEFIPILLTFSARTSANQTQDLIFSKFEVRRRASPQIWGAPLTKKFVVFVDDMNMPLKEQYGAQPPIEILRQFLDYNGWYDLKTREFFNITDVLVSGAMGPPGGGRNRITNRLARHFNLIACPDIDDASMKQIFGTMLSSFMVPFSEDIRSQVSMVVAASIEVFNVVTQELRPTPSRPHYLFNLRDVAKAIGGLLDADPKRTTTPNDLLRLWLHEQMRTFRDRLVNDEDRTWFDGLLGKQLQKQFKASWDDVVPSDKPLVFADFLKTNSSADIRPYEEVTDSNAFVQVIQGKLNEYNQQGTRKMELVLFPDAVAHVARIARIIRKANGHALLLGVGGSGRQSLARLAAYLNDMEVFQVEITKGYSMSSWREDLKVVLKKCAFQNKDMMFLFTDTQIAHEGMLEDVNNLLNSGEVPNLFLGPDLDEVFSAIKPVCVAESVPLDKLNMYARFIKFCKSNLHLAICMSPLGETFRSRLRMFPALVSCSTIDWFSAWPQQALVNVAKDYLERKELVQDPQLAMACVGMCVHIHQTVEEASIAFLEETKRHNYVTPTSYLELLHTFAAVFSEQMESNQVTKQRLINGLEKLRETEEAVADLQQTLEKNQPILLEKGEAIKKLVADMDVQTAAAKETQKEAEEEEKAVGEKQRECAAIEEEAQGQLAEALPELDRALESLKNLKSSQITEVAGYKAPTPGVVMTMQGMCILFQIKPVMRAPSPMEEKRPDYWTTAKEQLLNNPNSLMQRLVGYDKEHIPEKLIQSVMPLVNSEDFTPKKIAGASQACAAMCQWTHAMVKFHVVNKKVAPLRQRLEVAQEDNRITLEKLEAARERLEVVSRNLAKMQRDKDKAQGEMDTVERTVKATEVKLRRAATLIDGLAGEKKSWGITVSSLNEKGAFLVGDVLAAAGQIAYLGPFTTAFRVRLLKKWDAKLTELNIRHSTKLSVYHTLQDPIVTRSWFANGLPTDTVSVENALFVSKARRWPLMIDPQTQANKWIRSTYGSQLEVVKPNQRDVIKRIEYCLRAGRVVLLENVSEEIDPSLDPLLVRQTFMEGGQEMIRISENAIPWNSEFRFFMTTKLPNPHYTPEIMAKVSLLNFFITPGGLEEQLLGVIVGEERKELEIRRNDLIQKNADMRAELDSIQKTILKSLDEVRGDILDDEALIEYLNISKTKTAEIHQKVEEAEVAEKEINITREGFRPVAAHSATLYFCCATLCNVDPMYQYSLQWFVQLFIRCIGAAAQSDVLEERLENLRDYVTYNFYQNISRSLFEKHKLMFSFFLCVRIMQSYGQVNEQEFRVLLQGPPSASTDEGEDGDGALGNPAPDWLGDAAWAELCSLSATFPSFRGFEHHFVENIAHYEKVFMSANAHTEKLAGKWDSRLTPMHKMIFLRSLRPDKLMEAVQDFISASMGERFIKPPPFDLLTSFKDSTPAVPLIFILSQGADPFEDWKKFAESQRMGKKLADISLGQGQGPRAERLMREGMETGSWVLLQNCHLATSWMPALERLVESISTDVHPSFRLWLTSMPSNRFPVAVLQNGVKMTNEPPKGLPANVTRSLLAYNNDFLDDCSKPTEFKKMFFSMCLFHALIQERRKFGPLGWNIPYEFTSGDLVCCVSQIRMFLDKYDAVPFRVIKELSGHIHYGGRVTDDWDRRTLMTLLETFVCPEVLRDDYAFSPSGMYTSIPTTDQQGYRDYVSSWPLSSNPEIFGLHENADIMCARNETFETLTAVALLQSGAPSASKQASTAEDTPSGDRKSDEDGEDEENHAADAAAVSTPDELVSSFAITLLHDLVSPFDIDEFQSRYPTRYDDSMNTVLVQEAIRFNRLTVAMRTTLETLPLAIKGEVVMSKEMEEVYQSIFNNQVPTAWADKAYPSLKPLATWVTDLHRRLDMIGSWFEHGHPAAYWISGFFFPQAFLTGILQNYARKMHISVDSIEYDFCWLHETPESVSSPPEYGCYVYGMFVEGARIDSDSLKLVESKPKVLYEQTPMLWLTPVDVAANAREKKTQTVYKCPLYKTIRRAGTLSTTGHSTNYVLSANIPTDQEPAHWVKRGVAMVCSLNV